MLNKTAIAAVALFVMAVAPALGQCHKSADAGGPACQAKQMDKADAGASAKATGCCIDSPCFKGLDLPRMAYMVNDHRVTCPMAAQELAKAENAEIKYVVGEKVYTDKSEALEAEATALERFLNDMLTVQSGSGDAPTCGRMSGATVAEHGALKPAFRLASYGFADRQSAEKAAQSAREASEKVEMKMTVGDKAYSCPVRAGQAAEKEGCKVSYCVGSTKTTCKATAKVQLALERIKAALEACQQCGGKPISNA